MSFQVQDLSRLHLKPQPPDFLLFSNDTQRNKKNLRRKISYFLFLISYFFSSPHLEMKK